VRERSLDSATDLPRAVCFSRLLGGIVTMALVFMMFVPKVAWRL
jgi:hypothetical protein